MCSDELVKAIRQIPFRIMAEKAEIDEEEFIYLSQNTSAGIVFLDDDCEARFTLIANQVYWCDFIRFQYSMMSKRKEKSNLHQKESKSTYCKATEFCLLMSKTGLLQSINATKFNDILSEISPSAISKTFLDYHRIGYLFYSDEAKHYKSSTFFGSLYPDIVEFILEYYLNEENLFLHVASEISMTLIPAW